MEMRRVNYQYNRDQSEMKQKIPIYWFALAESYDQGFTLSRLIFD